MKQTSRLGNLTLVEKETYVCSSTEFNQVTTCEDGCQLEVVDESTHKVVGYYLAYNGYWNER